MEVLINFSHRASDLEVLPIKALALFIMAEQKLPDNTEVSISFVNNDEISLLNEKYRGKTEPTDVLSFECDNLNDDFDDLLGNASDVDSKMMSTSIYELGDIIIAPDFAEHHCEIYGTTFEGEMSLLIIHGLLHLCGFDHLSDEQAQLMEQRERKLLLAWADKGHEAVRDVREELPDK